MDSESPPHRPRILQRTIIDPKTSDAGEEAAGVAVHESKEGCPFPYFTFSMG